MLVSLLDDEPRRAALATAARARFAGSYDARVVGPVLDDFLANGRRHPGNGGRAPLTDVAARSHRRDPHRRCRAPALDAATRRRRGSCPTPSRDPPPRAKASRRVAITTIDQGFSSASNFAVGVVVAHIAGPAGLGAYAVAYTAWLALGTAHRALITDPMSIDNDVVARRRRARVSAPGSPPKTSIGLAAAAVLVVVSIPLIFSGLHSFGVALITLAPFLPFLLVQDYWRWVGFMQARPDRSLMNDAVFNCVQAFGVGALIVGGLRSPSVAIVAWGVGAAVGSRLRAPPVLGAIHDARRRGMIRSRWSMSKWFFAGGLASWGSAQAYPLLAGPGVGPVGLGGLKAAQNLMSGPTLVLIQAGGSIGLPEASHAARARRLAAASTRGRLGDGGRRGERRVRRRDRVRRGRPHPRSRLRSPSSSSTRRRRGSSRSRGSSRRSASARSSCSRPRSRRGRCSTSRWRRSSRPAS